MQPHRRGVTLCARLRVKFARSIPSSVILSGANIDRYLHSRDPQDRPKVGIYERFSITLSNHFARSKLHSNLPFGFRSAQDDARQSDPKHSYRILPHPPSSGAPLTDPPASGSFHRKGPYMCARLCVKFARCPPLSVILSGANIDRYLHSRNPQDRP